MIVVITAKDQSVESRIDDRFGRSPWLIRVDTKSNQWEALENPGASQSGGAGVAAAQFTIDQKAAIVVSGAFGPHAASAFRAAKIKMCLFTKGVQTVQQVIDLMANDQLPEFK